MDRRAFLGSVGVLALFTGCVGESPSDPSNSSPTTSTTESLTSRIPTTSRGSPRTDTPADEFFHMESEYTEPQKIVAINHQKIVDVRDVSYRNGTRKSGTDSTSSATEITAASPDQTTIDDSISDSIGSTDSIQIWNNSKDIRSIEIIIEVSDRPADPLEQETYVKDSPKNPILVETYTINPDAYMTVQLLKPGDYVVSVGVTGRQTIEKINYTTDNCNMQSLSIGIMPDESVKYFSISTEMACMSVNTVTTGTITTEQYD